MVHVLSSRRSFTRLFVEGQHITDQELNEPFGMVHDAYLIYRTYPTEMQQRRSSQLPRPGTYYRRSTGGARTSQLEASSLDDAGLLARPGSSPTASSADLPEETGATSRDGDQLASPGPRGPRFK
jgi:hypothetical protein